MLEGERSGDGLASSIWSIKSAIFAPYQASLLEGDALVAAFCVIPDGERRGWFVGYRGRALRNGLQLRQGRAWLEAVKSDFDELRAWVPSDTPGAQALAEWGGLRYDAGPATGLSPIGGDMTLMLWRR